jgi:hypothetical protein
MTFSGAFLARIGDLVHSTHRVEPVNDHNRMDGLRVYVKIVSPFVGVFQHVSGPGVPGHEQDSAIREQDAYLNCRINPRHPLHDDFTNKYIERIGNCSVNCLRAAVSGGGIEPKLIQNLDKRIGYKLFVIDNKDF